MLNDSFLDGAEAEVFSMAALALIDDVRTVVPDQGQTQRFEHEIGIGPFDELTWQQKIVLIDRVVACLWDSQSEGPAPAAYLDATVAAVFEFMFNLIEMEIDHVTLSIQEGDPTEVREMVLSAVVEGDSDGAASDLPSCDCDNAEEWRWVVQLLCDRVLHDQDWHLSSAALDLPPSKADEMKMNMGISGNYFSDAAPDATAADARTAWVALLERLTGKRLAEWRFGDGDRRHVMVADVVDAMEQVPDEWVACFVKQNYKIYTLPEGMLDESELEQTAEWFGIDTEEMIADAKFVVQSDYTPLPDKFAIHEWEIMKRFSQSVTPDSDRDELLDAIHGSGAFQSFRRTLDRLGKRDEWFKFHAEALEEIAIEWLDENNIQWLRESDLDPI